MCEDALLLLLRAALGAQVSCDELGEVQWEEVYRLAAEQGVLGPAFDGLQRICDSSLEFRDESLEKSNSLLSEDLYYSWLGQVMIGEGEYAKHCLLINQMSALLAERDIRMLLLKGVACSVNYPNPSHRKVGDIDIYCFEKGVAANQVFEENGIKVERDLSHHSRMVIDGVSIENHHLLMNECNYRSNRKFESDIQDLLKNSVEEVAIGGGKILVPAPTLMAVHLLRHSAMDFASNTMNLRQMLDYALLVDKRGSEIDWSRVEGIVGRLGMRGYFCAMNDIAVNVLGIEQSKFPTFKSDAALRDRILNDTFHSKRCHEFPNYHKKFIYGLAKSWQAWHNRWKNELVFNEGFMSLYWQRAKYRLKY